jgi:hypothetical protein
LKKSQTLFKNQWVLGKQYLIIENLMCHRSYSEITEKFFSLEEVTFVESHKVFGHNDYHVSEFMKSLRQNPQKVAELIVKSEKFMSQITGGIEQPVSFSNQHFVAIVFQSIYGNCIFERDDNCCLKLLEYLIDIQFSASDLIDVRKLIRKQSCSFNILFNFYTTLTFSTQLFLHVSFHDQITQLLNDEWYLDIDEVQALNRFSKEEIQKQLAILKFSNFCYYFS